jgi:hemin uptake protein HemP
MRVRLTDFRARVGGITMDQSDELSPEFPHDPPPNCPCPKPKEIPSDQLLEGSREIHIRHAGELYRLRLTRNGKLILHK